MTPLTRRFPPSVLRATCGAIVALLLVLAGPGAAQQPPPPASPTSSEPRFEAATIKPSPSNSEYGDTAVWQFVPNGDVTFSNAPLRLIIALAYQVDIQFQSSLLIGSDDLLRQRFDIRGKAPAQAKPQGSAMLRTLLEERFALRMHVETRDIPIYALTRVRPDRLGPDLRPSDTDCATVDRLTEPASSKLSGFCFGTRRDAQKMRVAGSGHVSELTRYLKQHLDRPLRDVTDLDGLYQWDVTFSVNRDPAADTEFPSMETAIRERLGLRIVPSTGSLEVRVIDAVRPPTEN